MTKCLLNNLSTFTNYQVVREVKHQPILAQHLVSIPNYTSIYLDYAVLDVEITRKGYRRRRYVSVKFGMTKKQKEPLIQWEYDNRSKQPYPRIKRGREVPVKIANGAITANKR